MTINGIFFCCHFGWMHVRRFRKFSLSWFFCVLTLYDSLCFTADISVVHPPVCPACYTVKFTLNIVDLTF